MHKRILVPSDGSVPAEALLPDAQDVAMLTKAEILSLGVLVNSAPEHSYLNLFLVSPIRNEWDAETKTLTGEMQWSKKSPLGVQKFNSSRTDLAVADAITVDTTAKST